MTFEEYKEEERQQRRKEEKRRYRVQLLTLFFNVTAAILWILILVNKL